MLSHLEPYPAGEFPYYSGLTTRHLGWLKPIKWTRTTVLCEVTQSTWDKHGLRMRFNRATGRLMSFEWPSMRNYMRALDFEAMRELADRDM